MSDLYANIALENMLTSAGEVKCEQPSHDPAYPCTVDALYLLRYGCTPNQPPLKVCENIFREVLDYQRLQMPCPCGALPASCWTIFPF